MNTKIKPSPDDYLLHTELSDVVLDNGILLRLPRVRMISWTMEYLKEMLKAEKDGLVHIPIPEDSVLLLVPTQEQQCMQKKKKKNLN